MLLLFYCFCFKITPWSSGEDLAKASNCERNPYCPPQSQLAPWCYINLNIFLSLNITTMRFFLIFCLFLAYWFYVNITTMRFFRFCSVLFVFGFLVLCKHDNLCIRSSKLTLKRVIICFFFQFHAKNVQRSFSSPQC